MSDKSGRMASYPEMGGVGATDILKVTRTTAKFADMEWPRSEGVKPSFTRAICFRWFAVSDRILRRSYTDPVSPHRIVPGRLMA